MKTRISGLVLVAALSFLIAIAGCDEAATAPDQEFDPQERYALLGQDEDVSLYTEADSFAPGAAVTLILDNQSGETIGYNLCFHSLDERTDGSWGPAEGQEGRACTTVLHTVGTSETASYETSLPKDLSSGEYRFRVALHLMESEDYRDQVSEGFQVDG